MRPESVKQAGTFSTECNPGSGNPCTADARMQLMRKRCFLVPEREPGTPQAVLT